MKFITYKDIVSLQIEPRKCVEWVRDAFLKKYESDLPPKISQKLPGDIFINTMPCIVPSLGIGGTKIVSRYPEREPSLDSVILIYELESGKLLALMDADWITAMRTGAVAALAVETFANKDYKVIGIIGLGNTARTTIKCLLSVQSKKVTIKLKRYKDQAEQFVEYFKNYPNVTFDIVEDNYDLIKGSDVVFSCVTVANELFGKDEWYEEGILVVPVHTRGFQNCDLFFDRVFADDRGHVKSFQYFDKFKYFNEFSKVLQDKDPGRQNPSERILAYNIGIALHDVYFAAKIYEILNGSFYDVDFQKPIEKFWV